MAPALGRGFTSGVPSALAKARSAISKIMKPILAFEEAGFLRQSARYQPHRGQTSVSPRESRVANQRKCAVVEDKPLVINPCCQYGVILIREDAVHYDDF